MHEFMAEFETIFKKYIEIDFSNKYLTKNEFIKFLHDFHLVEELGANQKYRFVYEHNEDTQGQTFAPIT